MGPWDSDADFGCRSFCRLEVGDIPTGRDASAPGREKSALRWQVAFDAAFFRKIWAVALNLILPGGAHEERAWL